MRLYVANEPAHPQQWRRGATVLLAGTVEDARSLIPTFDLPVTLTEVKIRGGVLQTVHFPSGYAFDFADGQDLSDFPSGFYEPNAFIPNPPAP